jgi:hypothetical protein
MARYAIPPCLLSGDAGRKVGVDAGRIRNGENPTDIAKAGFDDGTAARCGSVGVSSCSRHDDDTTIGVDLNQSGKADDRAVCGTDNRLAARAAIEIGQRPIVSTNCFRHDPSP